MATQSSPLKTHTPAWYARVYEAMRLMGRRRRVRFAAVLVCVAAVSVLAATAVYYRYQLSVMQAGRSGDYYPHQAWNKGEIIAGKDIVFTVLTTRTDTQAVPQYWPLPDGHHFVLVKVAFKNRTSTAYQLSPVTSMTLVDAAGTQYPVTGAPYALDPVGGLVAPGQTVTGEVGFTVPSDAQELRFYFKPYLQSSAPIWVDL